MAVCFNPTIKITLPNLLKYSAIGFPESG